MKNYLNKIKEWWILRNVPTDLNSLVIIEAKSLRENATEAELSNLNFNRLDPSNANRCIYGQMTGYCFNNRANDLIIKCAKRVYNRGTTSYNTIRTSTLNGIPYKTNSRSAYYFSPIEKFIDQDLPNQNENNKRLIAYLKKETDKLEFV